MLLQILFDLGQKALLGGTPFILKEESKAMVIQKWLAYFTTVPFTISH